MDNTSIYDRVNKRHPARSTGFEEMLPSVQNAKRTQHLNRKFRRMFMSNKFKARVAEQEERRIYG
jgi:hypothetical protein